MQLAAVCLQHYRPCKVCSIACACRSSCIGAVAIYCGVTDPAKFVALFLHVVVIALEQWQLTETQHEQQISSHAGLNSMSQPLLPEPEER